MPTPPPCRACWSCGPRSPCSSPAPSGVAAEVLERCAQRHALAPVAAVILSLEESADLDSTAVDCLRELDQRLARHGQRLVLARVKDAVRDLLTRCDADGLGRLDRLHWSVADAAQAEAGAAAAGQPDAEAAPRQHA